MTDESSWHGVGHTLVPPSNWPFLNEPGLRTLTEEGQRPDEQTGFIRVKVEPSNLVQPGVYIQINDHYQWDVPDGETAVDQVLKLLKDGWSTSLSRADAFTDEVAKVGGMPT
jgi:hypothetical protein